MGWTSQRWRESTFYEFECAVSGYWRNWERTTAWLAREINFIAICGNPNIKPAQKPKKPSDLYKLTGDKSKTEKLTAEEIEQIKNKLFNGIPKQPDSTD